MTPIGIWSIVKATLMLVTAPVPSVDASEVTTRKVIWLAPRPTARGAISTSALRAWSSPRSMRGGPAEPEPVQRPGLDEEMPHRSGDDADGEAGDAHRAPQDERRTDDREVVDDRCGSRGREPTGRVEDARRDRPEGQEDRAQQHDPRQLHGLVPLGLREPGRDHRDDRGRRDEEHDTEDQQPDHDEVGDRRDDPPGALVGAAGEEPRHDRDQGRGQGPGRHELEQQVGDPECREERVEIRAGRVDVGDDDDAQPAEDP